MPLHFMYNNIYFNNSIGKSTRFSPELIAFTHPTQKNAVTYDTVHRNYIINKHISLYVYIVNKESHFRLPLLHTLRIM